MGLAYQAIELGTHRTRSTRHSRDQGDAHLMATKHAKPPYPEPALNRGRARRSASDGTPATPLTLVYLDVDDEITSAAARIRAAGAERVALVLPYGSRLATSRINFRLLAREATERGKHIEIVCADSSARALAAGRRAARPSPRSRRSRARAVRRASGGRGGRRAARGPATTDASATGRARPRAPARDGPGVAGVPVGELEVDDDARPASCTLPRRSSPAVPLVGPPRPPVRTGLAVGIGAGGRRARRSSAASSPSSCCPSATIVLAAARRADPAAGAHRRGPDRRHRAERRERWLIPAQRFDLRRSRRRTPCSGDRA